MPRPGTKVIPDKWSGHHRPTAEGTMTAEVQLQRPTSEKTFDEVAGKSIYLPAEVLWSGVGRVQRLSRRLGGEHATGGRFVTEQMYQVSVPIAINEPQVNDQIYVTANPDDPKLVGKTMRVREVRLGSLAWERDLVCEETTPTTR